MNKRYPTLTHKGKYLHSPYNPLREAERLIPREKLQSKSLFILFEPGLGYPAEHIINCRPSAQLLIISLLNRVDPALAAKDQVEIWTPQARESLEAFLLNRIHESDLDRLSLIPWPPALRLMKEEWSRMSPSIKRVTEQLAANDAQVRGFGKMSVKNAFTNYLQSREYHLPRFMNIPVIIAASGPTLEKSLPSLAERGKGYFVIALPSAVKALRASGVAPDMVLSTDSGYWAGRHYDTFPGDLPVGIPLTGKANHEGRGIVFPLFHQNSPVEEALFSPNDLPGLPSLGSVALSAVLWSQNMGASSITLIGLDLCYDDIKSHCAPHSFDAFLETLSTRLKPLQHIYFDRALQTGLKEGSHRTGASLNIYRSWLENRSSPIPLFRYSPGTPSLAGITEISSLPEHKEKKIIWDTRSLPNLRERRERLKSLLENWQRDWNRAAQESFESFHTGYPAPFSDLIYTLCPDLYTRARSAALNEPPPLADSCYDQLGKEFTSFLSRLEELIERT